MDLHRTFQHSAANKLALMLAKDQSCSPEYRLKAYEFECIVRDARSLGASATSFPNPNARAASCPTLEDRVSGYNAFETPRSEAATDLGPSLAFYGPDRSQAFRSELRVNSE